MKKHYIIINNKKYQLPVPPSSYEITCAQNVGTVNLLNFGEVINGSTPNLKTWSIQKYFPKTNYLPNYISDNDLLKPWEYVKLFEDAKDKGIELIYIVTDTIINIKCVIDNFVYGEDDGTGDVNYTLSFKQNKKVELVSKDNIVEATGFVDKNSKYPYFYEVKDGDDILSICKKAYGDTSKFEELLEKNNLQNSEQIKAGMTLQL